MKTVFVPLLMPFFNFNGNIVGAARIYYGVIVSNSFALINCPSDEASTKFLESLGIEALSYCEVKNNPTLNYALEYAIEVFTGKKLKTARKDALNCLYRKEGPLVAYPQNIVVENYLTNNGVLMVFVDPGEKFSIEELECRNYVPSGRKVLFKELSKRYAEIMCDIEDVLENTATLALCYSCFKKSLSYIVKRENVGKLISKLINLGVNVDSIHVVGLFSKSFVIYERSPHVQKTS